MSSSSRRVQQISRHLSPQEASGHKTFKVAVLGAAGGIGQPLALLLKSSKYIHTLSLYDVVGTPGVRIQDSDTYSLATRPLTCVVRASKTCGLLH